MDETGPSTTTCAGELHQQGVDLGDMILPSWEIGSPRGAE